MLTAFVPSAPTADTHSLLIPAIPDLVWGSLAFIVVLVVVIRKFLPRMNAMFDARADAIEGGLKRAEEAQAGAQQALENYNAQLAEARAEASRIRDAAREDAKKIRTELSNKQPQTLHASSPTLRRRSRPSAPVRCCLFVPRSERWLSISPPA